MTPRPDQRGLNIRKEYLGKLATAETEVKRLRALIDRREEEHAADKVKLRAPIKRVATMLEDKEWLDFIRDCGTDAMARDIRNALNKKGD